jgi:hypothetical protein
MKRNWQRTLGLLALLAVLLPAAGHCYYDPGEGRWLSRDPVLPRTKGLAPMTIKAIPTSASGCSDKTFIYADAPGNLVFSGIEGIPSWSQHTQISATLRVKNGGETVGESSFSVTIDADASGKITTAKP